MRGNTIETFEEREHRTAMYALMVNEEILNPFFEVMNSDGIEKACEDITELDRIFLMDCETYGHSLSDEDRVYITMLELVDEYR